MTFTQADQEALNKIAASMTDFKVGDNERFAAKMDAMLSYAMLKALIDSEQWTVAKHFAGELQLKLRQLELLDLQRKQEE